MVRRTMTRALRSRRHTDLFLGLLVIDGIWKPYTPIACIRVKWRLQNRWYDEGVISGSLRLVVVLGF